MILVGLGSSGLRALEYTLKIIKEANLSDRIKSNSQTKIYITGFDTNEVVEREVNVSLTELNNALEFDGVYTWTIGLETLKSKDILSSIPNTGGVVSTKAGAGNRRKLGEISYKNSFNYQQIESTFRSHLSNPHEVIVVGSLAGGTASGVFPVFGEDIKQWGGNNLIGMWAVGLIPGHSHESVVRKANSVAALFDLKFQHDLWRSVFVLSPQGSADGGSKYITGKGDEKEAYRALLEFAGIFISILLLNSPLSGAGIPSDGFYTVKPTLSIILNNSVKHNKAVDILIEGLNKVFEESHRELSIKAVDKMNSFFFEKFANHTIGEGRISEHAKNFLSKDFLDVKNIGEFITKNIDELAEKTAWWSIFKRYLSKIYEELERNINDTWFNNDEILSIQSSLEDWVQSIKGVPFLKKIYEKRDEKKGEILKDLKKHQLGHEVYSLFKRWYKKWIEEVENLQEILKDYLNFSLRGNVTQIHGMIGLKINDVSFDGITIPMFDVKNLIQINQESIARLDELRSTDNIIKLWRNWGDKVVDELKQKLNFNFKNTLPQKNILFIELKSLPQKSGELGIDPNFTGTPYLQGSIEFYPVYLNNLLIFDESVQEELRELNTFNALRFISTDSQLIFLKRLLENWWINVATVRNRAVITKIRPNYAKILVKNNGVNFSPVGVKGVKFNITIGQNTVEFSPNFMGELWGWIEDYLKPALINDKTNNREALEIHKALGG